MNESTRLTILTTGAMLLTVGVVFLFPKAAVPAAWLGGWMFGKYSERAENVD